MGDFDISEEWLRILETKERVLNSRSDDVPASLQNPYILDDFQEKFNLCQLANVYPRTLKNHRDIRLNQNNVFAKEMLEKGLREALLGLYPDSIDTYTLALEVNPNDINLLLLRGAVLANTGDFGSASKDFSKILFLDPSHPQAAAYLSISMLEQEGSHLNISSSVSSMRLNWTLFEIAACVSFIFG
ncbi:Tetratricopeptide repeat protein 14 [Entomophthora muscae]|uniref:Tetratricopeptide repeat protein 14 n=1 Tax=Entomophthora muscae TaxID=34485 RepID=A0ACC2RFB1_9FUNG|nr:Tetratricopeptide repeat protein 14 [Entomophthora muscae]